PLHVLLWPKEPDRAVPAAEGLEPLEQRLAVMQDGCGRVEREGRVRLDARVVPALLFLEVGDEHVVGEDVAEGEVLVLRLFLAVRRLRDPDRVSHCLSPLSASATPTTACDNNGPRAPRRRSK